LTEGVLKTMLVTKLKFAAVVLLAASLVGLGTTAVTYRALASDQGVSADAAVAKAAAEDREKQPRDDERGKRPAGQQGPTAGRPDPFDSNPQAGDEPKQGKQGPADGRAGDSSRLRGLLKERLAAVQQLADRVKQLRKQGGASQEAVRQADLRVYKAEL